MADKHEVGFSAAGLTGSDGLVVHQHYISASEAEMLATGETH